MTAAHVTILEAFQERLRLKSLSLLSENAHIPALALTCNILVMSDQHLPPSANLGHEKVRELYELPEVLQANAPARLEVRPVLGVLTVPAV